MKNRHTPPTLMTAPITSRRVTFWWKISAAGAMISTGVRAKRVCAMPVAVYSVAISERLTPTNGPKNIDQKAHFSALRSFNALRSGAALPLENRNSSRRNPASPMVPRIMVEANGMLILSGIRSSAPSGTASAEILRMCSAAS